MTHPNAHAASAASAGTAGAKAADGQSTAWREGVGSCNGGGLFQKLCWGFLFYILVYFGLF